MRNPIAWPIACCLLLLFCGCGSDEAIRMLDEKQNRIETELRAEIKSLEMQLLEEVKARVGLRTEPVAFKVSSVRVSDSGEVEAAITTKDPRLAGKRAWVSLTARVSGGLLKFRHTGNEGSFTAELKDGVGEISETILGLRKNVLPGQIEWSVDEWYYMNPGVIEQ